MKPLTSLSALALASCLLPCLVCAQHVGAEEINVAGAVAGADSILVGKVPAACYRVTAGGETRSVTEGYTIEVERFLKGAGQYPAQRVAPQPCVTIYLNDLSREEKESLRVPQARDATPSYIYFLRLKRPAFPLGPREMPLTPDQWFLPATADNIKAVEDQLPKPEAWGAESEGLRLGIRPLKSSYRPNEDTVIELYIQNVSDRTILIAQHRLWSNDYYPFTYFRATPYAEFEKPLGIGHKRALSPVRLAPGRIHSESIRLDSWQWGTPDGLCPFRSGTRLKIMACYDTRSIPDELRFLALEKDRLWKGFLASPYVDLKFERTSE